MTPDERERIQNKVRIDARGTNIADASALAIIICRAIEEYESILSDRQKRVVTDDRA